LRLSVIVVVLLCGLFPELAGAQTTGASSVTVSHPTLALGQAETITVVARDLAGRPLPNAAVTIVVRFGTRTVTYHPKHTDGAGRTSLSFHAPSGLSSGKIPVLVTISNGYLTTDVGEPIRVEFQSDCPPEYFHASSACLSDSYRDGRPQWTDCDGQRVATDCYRAKSDIRRGQRQVPQPGSAWSCCCRDDMRLKKEKLSPMARLTHMGWPPSGLIRRTRSSRRWSRSWRR